MPNVRVIVANYNDARFLHQRIGSILAQTLQPVEIILMDDASTDNSREILASYSGDSRITLDFNRSNSGCVFKQWNRGLRQVKGDYIWIAESDDYSHVGFLERLVGALDSNPSGGMAYCQS